MPRETPVATFFYSRAHRVLVWAGAVCCLALIGTMIIGLWVSIPPGRSIDEWIFFVGGTFLVIYLVCLLRLHWKYRHVYKIRYAVSSDGIWTGDHGAESFASWKEVSHAEYMPLLSVFRIQMQHQQHPIVLFLRRPDEFDTDKPGGLAKKLVREGLKDRLRTVWLPW